MCGIICAFNARGESVGKWVRNQLQEQLGRGKEGFGAIMFDPNRSVEIERSKEIAGLLVPLMFKEEESNGIFLHHRNPTSTENTIGQTHPILCSDKDFKYDWYVMHNGVITNDEDVRDVHEAMGIEYVTAYEGWSSFYKKSVHKFNDSECVAWEVALVGESSDKLKKGGKLKLRTEGNNAFMALKVDKKTGEPLTLLWGRNSGNPLNMHKGGKDEFFWSSEGIGESVKTDTMFEMNLNTLNIIDYPLVIPTRQETPVLQDRESIYGNDMTDCSTDGCEKRTWRKDGLCHECNEAKVAAEKKEALEKVDKLCPALIEADELVPTVQTTEPQKNETVIGYDTDEYADPFDIARERLDEQLDLLIDSMRDLYDGSYPMDYENEKNIFLGHVEKTLDRLYDSYVRDSAIAYSVNK